MGHLTFKQGKDRINKGYKAIIISTTVKSNKICWYAALTSTKYKILSSIHFKTIIPVLRNNTLANRIKLVK